MCGSVILLRLLLNYHADVNAMSTLRETAVIAACRKHKPSAVEFLVKRGARLDVIDRSQYSALRWVVTHADVSLVKLLLRHKVSVTHDSYTANSALSIALSSSSKCHAKIALLLQRQLVAERRQLLQDIVKQKERDEIKAIKRHRRKMHRQVAAQQRGEVAIEPPPATEHATGATPSPFALPIIPSLKAKPRPPKPASDADNTSRAGAIATRHRQPKVDSVPIQMLLLSLLTPPATTWVRVDRGTWRQEVIHPRSPGKALGSEASHTPVIELQSSDHSARLEPSALIKSEALWNQFKSESMTPVGHRPLHIEELEGPLAVEILSHHALWLGEKGT